MRSWPVSLTGTSLCFDRDGRRLIVVAPHEIAVLDVATSQALRLPYARARAAAGFAEELWIATHDHRLVRVDWTGEPLGAPAALPFTARAVLVPAPCGPPAAIWPSMPAVALIGAAEAVACAEVPAADAVIPITGQRFVTARGSRLTLPSGRVVLLPPNTTVLGGRVTPDARSLTLLTAGSGGRQLIVISLGLGQVTYQRAISGREPISVAQSIAAIQLEPRVLWVVDLGTQRELGRLMLDQNVAAFALDPTGRAIAIREDLGDVSIHRLDPLFERWTGRMSRPRDADAHARGDRAAAPGPIAVAVPDATAPADRPAGPPDAAGDTVAPSDAAGDGAGSFEHLVRWLGGPSATSLSTPIAPAAIAREAPGSDTTAAEVAIVRPLRAAVRATDWICGSDDYAEGAA